jgi:hypothetical protein
MHYRLKRVQPHLTQMPLRATLFQQDLGTRGMAVQVDPIKRKLNAPEIKHLQTEIRQTSLNFCFKNQLAPLHFGPVSSQERIFGVAATFQVTHPAAAADIGRADSVNGDPFEVYACVHLPSGAGGVRVLKAGGLWRINARPTWCSASSFSSSSSLSPSICSSSSSSSSASSSAHPASSVSMSLHPEGQTSRPVRYRSEYWI